MPLSFVNIQKYHQVLFLVCAVWWWAKKTFNMPMTLVVVTFMSSLAHTLHLQYSIWFLVDVVGWCRGSCLLHCQFGYRNRVLFSWCSSVESIHPSTDTVQRFPNLLVIDFRKTMNNFSSISSQRIEIQPMNALTSRSCRSSSQLRFSTKEFTYLSQM